MADNMDDVVGLIRIIRPRRDSRRMYAGVACTMCGLGIVARDFATAVLVTESGREEPRAIHTKCGTLLMEMAADMTHEMETE